MIGRLNVSGRPATFEYPVNGKILYNAGNPESVPFELAYRNVVGSGAVNELTLNKDFVFYKMHEINLSGDTGNTSGINTVDKVDLTNYNSVRAVVSAGDVNSEDNGSLRISCNSTIPTDYTGLVDAESSNQVSPFGVITITIDVSALTGEYYVLFDAGCFGAATKVRAKLLYMDLI